MAKRGRPRKNPEPGLTLHEKAARYDAIIEQARKRAGYVKPPANEFERGMAAMYKVLTMPAEELQASIDALKRALDNLKDKKEAEEK